MSETELYEALRQLADSWGLLAAFVLFLVLVAWPFRPGAQQRNEAAANAIFDEGHDDV